MALTRIANIASTIPDDSIANVKMANIVQSKNILINGDMSVAQRATSASSITGDGYNVVDRFINEMNTAGTWTISQDTDVPTGQGFAKSLKYDCTTANGSLSAGSYGFVGQRLEGQNLQYLKFGTASAESLTLSFWVKSVKTGTYIVEIPNFTSNKSQSQSYTVDSGSTWEKKTLTFSGDTATTIANSNARSFNVNFWLVAGTTYTSGTLNTSYNTLSNANRAVGQVNLADSTSNDFWITGVQLEVGTTASDFEFLPYDVNLNRCLRYYEKNGDSVAGCYYSGRNDGISRGLLQFIVPKRAAPTCTVSVRGNATWDLASVFTVSLYNFDFGRSADYASFSLYTASAEL
jgi:hypothetical protein